MQKRTRTAAERREQLDTIFRNIDDAEKQLVDHLLDEVVYLETRMHELKELPFIEVHPRNAAKQRQTAAAKQYKECSQSYMNAIRILLNTLRKEDNDAETELLRALKEYELS